MIRVLLTALMLAGPAGAADMLEGTPAEAEALKLYDQEKHIEAREKAQAILAEDPDSFIGTFVMAAVYFRLEANLPRALFLLRQTLRQLEAAHGHRPETAEAVFWHKRILRLESWILSDMDDREGQLASLDRYNALYAPKREVHKMWPLLKLRRYDEAVAIGKRLIYSDVAYERRRAYNGLMAVEDERRRRKASFEWGQRGYANTLGKACIINSNLALAARRAFRLEDAERYDKEALKTEDDTCPTSPYAQLTTVYLINGQLQQSLSALEELRKIPRTPDQRIQNEMTIKGRLVELLYALGQLEPAVTRSQAIIRMPDRTGTTSASAESIELSNAVLHWAVLDARVEQLRERAAVRGLADALDVWVELQDLLVERWETRRLAIRLSTLDDLLVDTVSPYYSDVMPWYGGAMIEMLGPGLMTKMVTVARVRDVDYPQVAQGYYDTTLGELAWRQGDLAEATRLGGQALTQLPVREVSLRWRIRAWMGDSHWRQGQREAAERHWQAVLRDQPSVLRHLGITLPVRFEGDGGAADEAIDRLRASPRFQAAESAFTVRASTLADGLQICLLGPGGLRYACHGAKGLDDPDDEEGLLAAVDGFHDKALSPKLELTQKDINSLDGHAMRGDAAQAIKGLLGKER